MSNEGLNIEHMSEKDNNDFLENAQKKLEAMEQLIELVDGMNVINIYKLYDGECVFSLNGNYNSAPSLPEAISKAFKAMK